MFAIHTSFYLGILKVQVDNASLTFWSQRSLILLKCLRRHTQKDLVGVSRSLTRCLPSAPTIPVLLPAQLSQERLRRKSVSAVIWKNRPLALDRRRGCWPGEENGARRTRRAYAFGIQSEKEKIASDQRRRKGGKINLAFRSSRFPGLCHKISSWKGWGIKAFRVPTCTTLDALSAGAEYLN